MRSWKYLKSIDTMERITRQELCDNFDSILDRVEKEDCGFVILNEEGKDSEVLCPAEWLQFMYDKDFGFILIAAVRYALGRTTFMPNHVVDFVKRYINVLDSATIKTVIEDIDFYLEDEEPSDKKLWEELRYELWTRREWLLEKDEIEAKKRQLQLGYSDCNDTDKGN